METFETLNALKTHGLPKVMGVLTHLDGFRTNKQVNAVKRKMKHRFWTEICDGAKLFYLSGIINGKYLKREIMNLARFISVMKYRPLEFRSTHPYVLADRMEDLTPPALLHSNPLCDRRIALYGYVRGTMLHPRQQLHVMGVGDYVAVSFQLLDDPCGCKRRKEEGGGGKRKKLNEKEKRMYAPMSDIGEVMYDDDAMYIDMKAKQVHYTTEDKLVRVEGEETAAERAERERKERERTGLVGSANDESVAMVRAMQGVREAVDEKLRGSEIQLFKGGELLTEEEVKEAEQEDEEGEEEDEEMARLRAEEAQAAVEERMSSRAVMHKGRMRRKVVWNDDDDDEHSGASTAANGTAGAKYDDEEAMDDDDAADGEMNGVDDEGVAGEDDEYYRDNYEETRQQLRAAGVNQLTIDGKKYRGGSKVAEETKEAADDEESMEDENNTDERNEDEVAVDVDEGDDEDEDEEVDGDAGSEDEAGDGAAHSALSSLSLSEQKQQSNSDRHISTAWKDDILTRATATHQRTTNIMQLVYGTSTANNNNGIHSSNNSTRNKSTTKLDLFADDADADNDDNATSAAHNDNDDDDDALFSIRRPGSDELGPDSVTLSLRADEQKAGEAHDWTEDDEFESVRNRFVTGDWSEEVKGIEDDDEQRDSEEEEEDKRRKRKERKGRRGKHEAETTAAAHTTDNSSTGGEEEADHGISVEDNATAAPANETEEQATQRRQLAKEQQKAAFNSSYDKPSTSSTTTDSTTTTADDQDKDDTTHLDGLNAAAATQSVLDSTAFSGLDEHSRVLLEGARPGQYIRIELSNIPCEFITHFSPNNPLVIGGLLPHESGVGWLQCRVKRHRWHKKILKSNDMLIISNGWRRYQTLPVYAMEDRTGRLRYLKYTPEHMHCNAVMYGPLAAVNSGFLAYQYEGGNTTSFRIALTGTVLAQSKGKEKEYAIVKKLKLIGHPMKIFKHTAFIKDMFTSSTEVARFINASLRTVSGIRGAVKAAITTQGHDGLFRATFEDRIVSSDIVVCRSWSTVDVHAFYAPVQNYLVAGGVWRGLRTVREVREAAQKWAEQRSDSAYGSAIERRERKFSALHVPKTLAKQLPFAAKEKVMPPRAANRPLYEEARLVVRSKEEKELYTFMQHVNTVKGVRDDKRKEARGRQREKYLKKKAVEEDKHATQNKAVRKRRYEAEGQGRVVKYRKYTDK